MRQIKPFFILTCVISLFMINVTNLCVQNQENFDLDFSSYSYSTQDLLNQQKKTCRIAGQFEGIRAAERQKTFDAATKKTLEENKKEIDEKIKLNKYVKQQSEESFKSRFNDSMKDGIIAAPKSFALGFASGAGQVIGIQSGKEGISWYESIKGKIYADSSSKEFTRATLLLGNLVRTKNDPKLYEVTKKRYTSLIQKVKYINKVRSSFGEQTIDLLSHIEMSKQLGDKNLKNWLAFLYIEDKKNPTSFEKFMSSHNKKNEPDETLKDIMEKAGIDIENEIDA